jgi:hypothetical protein
MIASVVLSVAGLSQGGGAAAAGANSVGALGWGYAVSLLTAWTLMIIAVSFYRISRESHEQNLAALAARVEEETTS